MTQGANSLQEVSPRASAVCRILVVGQEPMLLQDKLAQSKFNLEYGLADDLPALTANFASDSSRYPCDILIVNIQDSEASTSLHLATLPIASMCKKLFVLSPTDRIPQIRSLPGIDCIFETPANMDVVVGQVEKNLDRLTHNLIPVAEVALPEDHGQPEAIQQETSSEPETCENVALDDEIQPESEVSSEKEAPVDQQILEENDVAPSDEAAEPNIESDNQTESLSPRSDETGDEDEGQPEEAIEPEGKNEPEDQAELDDKPVLENETDPVAEPEPEDETAPEAKAVTTGFETTLGKAKKIDTSIWRGFLPVVNFAYKKLAIFILTALFLTFLAYGVMIVFFLSSSSWTLPFELSSGHQLVEKTRRDLSQIRVRENTLRQQLTVNTTELFNAARKRLAGQLQIDAIGKSVDEEIYVQQRIQAKLRTQVGRLNKIESAVVKAKSDSGFKTYYQSLKKAFERKVVSRRAVEGVRLTLLESDHRLATIRNEISEKKENINFSARWEGQLKQFASKMTQGEFSVAPLLGTKFSYLTQELLAARTAKLSAESDHAAAKARKVQLEDSLKLVSNSIALLEKTPLARAIKEPVTVLFVPYSNAENAVEGQPIYGCRFFIIGCKNVGAIGIKVEGETNAPHPLFEKPLRGYFVEAKLKDTVSAKKELLHIGGAPLLF